MTTEPSTQIIRARIPTAVMTALQDDADALGIKPGTVVRKLLEGRYSSSKKVGKPDLSSETLTSNHTADAPEEPDWGSSPLPKD